MIANLRERARDVAKRAGLPRFWHWWLAELAPVLPWRAALQRRFTRPVVELTDNEAVFWRAEFHDGVARLAATEKVHLSGDPATVLAAGRAAVARLATKGAGVRAPKVVLALGARKMLRKEIALPAAVEENLAQTLAYDLDRHTPFRPEQLYFDMAVIGRDPERKMLRVDWAAALRSVVDGARAQIEAWGAVVVAVVPAPPKPGPNRLNLLPDAARPLPLQWRRWQVWAPCALVAVLAAAAVVIPLAQKRAYAIALGAETAAAAQRALAADALRGQLEGLQNDYDYALAHKYAYPSTLQVLDDITRILPDDTWLSQFEMKTSGRGKETRRDIYLRGESENAGKLISLLEDSKLVEQAAPRSPTTKVQGGSGEVFDLGARLKPLALPAAEPLRRPPLASAPPPRSEPSASAPAAAPATAPPGATAEPGVSPPARPRGEQDEPVPAAPAGREPAPAPEKKQAAPAGSSS